MRLTSATRFRLIPSVLSVLLLMLLAPAAFAGPYNAAAYPASGTLTFAASGKPGFGQELSLSGAVPWVRPPSAVFDTLGSTWTIQCWVKTSIPNRMICGHDAAAGAWNLGTDSSGNLHLNLILAGMFTQVSSAMNLCDGAYHHVVLMVCPGSTGTGASPTTSFYLLCDGNAVGSVLNAPGAYSTVTAINDDIGSSAGQPMFAWNGTIDDFAVSSVLEYPTVDTYTVPAAPIIPHAGLVALYHFDGDAADRTTLGPLVAGTPVMVANGDGTATLDAGTATGGSGNYAYQWYYRIADDDLNTTVVGTGRTLVLTGLPNGVARRYAVNISDGSTSVTIDFIYAVAQIPLVLEFIGDSLTGGAGNDQLVGTDRNGNSIYEPPAPTVAGNYLQALLGGAYKVIVHNHGHGGSRSDQWRTDSTTGLPQDPSTGAYPTVAMGAPNTLLNDALAEIDASVAEYGADHVIIPVCLGTNDPDTGDLVSDGNATAVNLVNILTALQATGAKVALQDIPWRAGYGNTYNAARNGHFDSIVAQLGTGVYRGDKGGVIAYQAGHPEFYIGGNGPHDFQAQQNVRGAIWGAAIAKNVLGVGASRQSTSRRSAPARTVKRSNAAHPIPAAQPLRLPGRVSKTWVAGLRPAFFTLLPPHLALIMPSSQRR